VPYDPVFLIKTKVKTKERSIPRTLGTPTIGNLINNATFMINVDLGWGKQESGNEKNILF